MKKIILILVVLLPMIAHSQTNPVFEEKPTFSSDSTLNSFIVHWLGKPYRLGGSTERGIDCSQFTKRLYKDVYSKKLGDVAAEQWRQTDRVKKDSLVLGDLVFFRSRQSPSGWHCGMYIGNTYFIHASNKVEGVKISSLNEPRYKKAYKGGGRLNK